jgi:hypothetical protein
MTKSNFVSFLSIGFLICFFSACDGIKKVSDDETYNKYTLVKSGNLVLNIDSTTKRFGNLISYSELEQSLSLYNDFNHSIYFYRIPDGDLIKKVSLEKEGVNGVFRVTGLYFYNQDSIFTYNQYTQKITILNDSGKKLDEFTLLDVGDPGMPFSPSLYYENGNIYFTVVGYKATVKEKKYKSLLIYNIRTKNRKFLIDTPSEYMGNWSDRSVVKDGVLIYGNSYVNSWGMGNKLIALKIEDETINISNPTSNYIQYPKEYEGNIQSMEERLYYQRTNSWNIDLYFAKHQKVILRAVNIGTNLPKGEDIGSGSFASQNGDDIFDLTELFNIDLVKIGEVYHLSFYGEIFSAESGIYIADYQYDEGNEDVISFGRYNLQKYEEK